MSLSLEQQASFTRIIDDILANADLNTISAKRIRKGLQAKVDHDISSQKDEITALIMARFDKFNSEQNGVSAHDASEPVQSIETPMTTDTISPSAKATPAKANGTSKPGATPKKRSGPDDSEEPTSLSSEQSPPPKKKHKRITGQALEEDDAAYAARLQEELNRLNGRATRGGGRAKPKPVKKKGTAKKKSAAKVNSDDDSEVDSNGEKKEVKRTGGFHKPMALSPALADLLSETQLSRPQTVKRIWQYVKERELQDPSDKRQIRCDDALRAVFKTDRVHMFTMNKILNQNLYALDE